MKTIISFLLVLFLVGCLTQPIQRTVYDSNYYDNYNFSQRYFPNNNSYNYYRYDDYYYDRCQRGYEITVYPVRERKERQETRLPDGTRIYSNGSVILPNGNRR